MSLLSFCAETRENRISAGSQSDTRETTLYVLRCVEGYLELDLLGQTGTSEGKISHKCKVFRTYCMNIYIIAEKDEVVD